MASTTNNWTDDFNPFLDQQRRHDEARLLVQKQCEEKQALHATDSGLLRQEDVRLATANPQTVFMLKSVLSKNFWRVKLTKVRESAKERHQKPHWCDIDAADNFETDEGVKLLPKVLEGVV